MAESVSEFHGEIGPPAGATGGRAQAFETFVTRRTVVSAGQSERLYVLGDAALSREARSVAQILGRFADAVALALRDPGSAVSTMGTFTTGRGLIYCTPP